MRKSVFTDIAVRNMKPGPTRREIPDPGARGLYLVIQPSGAKSWCVRYRINRKPRKLTLQPAGLALAAARKIAADTAFKISQGIDPSAERKANQDRAALDAGNTLRAIAVAYMKIAGSSLRSARERQSVLDRLILPVLGNRPIAEIERDDIVRLFDKVAEDNGPRASDYALAILSRIFRWHEQRTSRFRSPVISGMSRLKPSDRARERVLSDDEIKRVWNACGDARMGVFGQCIRFILLTGARRTEATALPRSEIKRMRSDTGTEYAVWELPASRSKSKRTVVRPLSRAAQAIIESAPRIGGSDFIFTLDGRKAIRLDGGEVNPKSTVDKISGVSGWRLHDLRRTCRTLMSRLRVSFDTAELALGHSPPGGLIRKTYDRASHLDALAESFDRLAAEIERIVSDDPDAKVIRPSFGR